MIDFARLAKDPHVISLFEYLTKIEVVRSYVWSIVTPLPVGAAVSARSSVLRGIVLLNAGIAAVTENDANNALEALQAMSQPMQTVLRYDVDRYGFATKPDELT